MRIPSPPPCGEFVDGCIKASVFSLKLNYVHFSGPSQADIASYLIETLLRADSKEAWNYAQTQPSLFERGGYFYRMIDQDLGPVSYTHLTLPTKA